MKTDRDFQRLAIEEAKLSRQEKQPSLFVGVVVVRDGSVIAKAHRGQFRPGDHAEFTALECVLAKFRETAANSTVYTTLEPCILRGPDKTPCAQRLVQHRVRRVIIGAIDPNVSIRGGGVKLLQTHGIEVQLFDHDLVNELHALNREFEREQASAPVRLAPRIASLTNQDTPADACLEFLRLENLYAPREEMPALFDRAMVMTDEAGERTGWDVLTINADAADAFESHCRRFATETAHIIQERGLGRHYLAVAVTALTVGQAHACAEGLSARCEGMNPRLGILVLLGWMAQRVYVPITITGA